MSQQPKQPGDDKSDFLNAAGGKQQGLVGEFVSFMKENKAWWLTPILLVIGLVGVLLALGATGASAFLYNLF